MNELITENHPDTATDTVYFRTGSGSRLHLPECPHLTGSDTHVATAAERLAHPVCDWSQAQLGGYGRQHFDVLEDAMRRVGVPVESHAEILGALRFVAQDEVFVVHSLTYGALGFEGRTVAGFGKTYYWVAGRRVNLPAYVDSTRGGRGGAQAYGTTCPIHQLTMSLSGVCDDC